MPRSGPIPPFGSRLFWSELEFSNDRIGTPCINANGMILRQQRLILMVLWDVTDD